MGEGTYAARRDLIRAALCELTHLTGERGSPTASESARALERRLAENRFNVVVFGEFKRGKTTLVNALLGAEMLPAAVVPLTSIVTAVTYGGEVAARVSYEGGREEEVPAGDLADYVTERGNPGNHLGVRQAVLAYPAEDLRDGVFLVDTPGVGSVYRHNTEAARRFLPEADAAIFITSADPPISDAERAFLEEIRDEAGRLFFVLNKVDYLSGLDRDEAAAFTRGVIADAIGHDVRLYPLSARRALLAKLVQDEDELVASGLPLFERDLRDFLFREKGRAVLESAARRAMRIVHDEENALDVEQRALDLSQEELDAARRRMEVVFLNARTRRRDMHALLRQEGEALLSRVEEDLARFRREEEARLLAAAEELVARVEDVRQVVRDVDGFVFVREMLIADIDRWRRSEELELDGAFQDAVVRLLEETGRLEQETVRLCGEILGIQLVSEPHPIDLSSESRFDFSFFEPPTILGSIVPDVRRFLPQGVVKRLVLRDVRERIPPLVDKHSGRLRWDFVQRLEKSRRELELVLDRRLEATIGGLRAGIERSEVDRRRSAEDAVREAETLDAFRLRLDRVRRSLRSVAAADSRSH